MTAWLKRHERKLWWAFLVASVGYGLSRNPNCASGFTTAEIVVSVALCVLIVGMFAWTMKTLTAIRQEARRDDR